MFELAWEQKSSVLWTCNHGKWYLKKRLINGRERYEIWKGEVLQENCLNYWTFMALIKYEYKSKAA